MLLYHTIKDFALTNVLGRGRATVLRENKKKRREEGRGEERREGAEGEKEGKREEPVRGFILFLCSFAGGE